jgi:hypothetical protein
MLDHNANDIDAEKRVYFQNKYFQGVFYKIRFQKDLKYILKKKEREPMCKPIWFS